jgi:hypothetical protein
MKNIHILPTDKPSRLFKFANQLIFDKETGVDKKRNQHIYITNSEDIKDGYVTDGENLFKVISNNFKTLRCTDKDNNLIKLHELRVKKIILTTDPILIQSGVQEIDDEFIKWLVQNPSCEEVEVFQEKHHIGEVVDESYPKGFFDYKIIIPKEEHKQTIQ